MIRLLILGAFAVCAASGHAQLPPPTLAPQDGVLRVWGNAQMESVVKQWAKRFQTIHPGIRVEANLSGSDVAMAALYTDKADIALVGRRATEMEAKAFEWIYRYPPSRIEVMTGSDRVGGKSPALAVLVHDRNPLARISLDQLRAIVATGDTAITTWGDLGVRGRLAAREIRLYLPDAESGTGRFLRHALLDGGNKLPWQRVTEFSEPVVMGHHSDQMGGHIVAALSGDPGGLAIAEAGAAIPGVRVIPLAGEGGEALLPTPESVRERNYPLARSVYAYFNRPPGEPLSEQVSAFLNLALSRDGQRMAEGGGYLALDERRVSTARAYLNDGIAALPEYVPEQEVSGTIRNYGNGFAGLLVMWESAFQRHQPGVRFDDELPTSDAAFPALITDITDLAPNGSEPALTETLGFYETHGYHATAVTVASGSFDVEGHSPGVVVFVHESNPIPSLSLAQLDGIFGSQRNGGLRGFEWSLEDARGPELDLRTWGQLGLGGAWRDRQINTYGHAPSGAARFFQYHILHNSDKWNPNYRGYVETGSKMIGVSDRETQRGGIRHMLADELANDPGGIAWTIMPQAAGIGGIRAVPLKTSEDAAAIVASRESFLDRSYPLVRSIYIYLDRKPGTPVAPRLREFLRFILSAEGQQIVAADGGFLPLPPGLVAEQRAKLD